MKRPTRSTGRSKGYAWTSAGEGHAGKVCLPRMQSRGMG